MRGNAIRSGPAAWLLAFAFCAAPGCGSEPQSASVEESAPAREGETSGDPLLLELERRARDVEARVIAWRRDFHQHPELSNRELRTAARVAEHLEALGLELRREVAHTGVVGVLRGGRPGGSVALRADMDALPVEEATGLPFASRQRATYLGREVGVMHACGHDAHTAILMGVAQVLAELREDLPGDVLFLFQPAEEGAPPGERGGAALMIEEGALADPRPDAIFGLHVVPQLRTGEIGLREGGIMASSDRLQITVRGRQTHAAYPWLGIDPIAAAARIVLGLTEIPARAVDARIPGVVSIGSVHGGVRNNIIPGQVELLGTIRSLEPEHRQQLHEVVRQRAEALARASGAEAEVEISLGYPITWNDPELVARIRPTLRRVAGEESLLRPLPRTGAEDFSYYQQEVPGAFLWLGIRAPGVAPEEAPPNHSPHFVIDEDALLLGVRALANLALDSLRAPATP